MPINLNTASAQTLTQLPHIGADKARRIVPYRAIRKGFRDWADFAGTPGITEADVEAIRTRAWIGPPAEEVLARRRNRRRQKLRLSPSGVPFRHSDDAPRSWKTRAKTR